MDAGGDISSAGNRKPNWAAVVRSVDADLIEFLNPHHTSHQLPFLPLRWSVARMTGDRERGKLILESDLTGPSPTNHLLKGTKQPIKSLTGPL